MRFGVIKDIDISNISRILKKWKPEIVKYYEKYYAKYYANKLSQEIDNAIFTGNKVNCGKILQTLESKVWYNNSKEDFNLRIACYGNRSDFLLTQSPIVFCGVSGTDDLINVFFKFFDGYIVETQNAYISYGLNNTMQFDTETASRQINDTNNVVFDLNFSFEPSERYAVPPIDTIIKNIDSRYNRAKQIASLLTKNPKIAELETIRLSMILPEIDEHFLKTNN